MIYLSSSEYTFFQQIINIPFGTNCGPLLVNLFFYLFEAAFIGLVCLMPLSTIFQLHFVYHGGQLNQSTQRKPPTCRKSLTNFIA
jgi:hypothetical protein